MASERGEVHVDTLIQQAESNGYTVAGLEPGALPGGTQEGPSRTPEPSVTVSADAIIAPGVARDDVERLLRDALDRLATSPSPSPPGIGSDLREWLEGWVEALREGDGGQQQIAVGIRGLLAASFWEFTARAKAEVDGWPKWKRDAADAAFVTQPTPSPSVGDRDSSRPERGWGNPGFDALAGGPDRWPGADKQNYYPCPAPGCAGQLWRGDNRCNYHGVLSFADATPPSEDRSEPPPGYMVDGRQAPVGAFAEMTKGPCDYGEFEDRDDAIAACWEHRDAVLASTGRGRGAEIAGWLRRRAEERRSSPEVGLIAHDVLVAAALDLEAVAEARAPREPAACMRLGCGQPDGHPSPCDPEAHAEHDRETLAKLENRFKATGPDLIEAIDHAIGAPREDDGTCGHQEPPPGGDGSLCGYPLPCPTHGVAFSDSRAPRVGEADRALSPQQMTALRSMLAGAGDLGDDDDNVYASDYRTLTDFVESSSATLGATPPVEPDTPPDPVLPEGARMDGDEVTFDNGVRVQVTAAGFRSFFLDNHWGATWRDVEAALYLRARTKGASNAKT